MTLLASINGLPLDHLPLDEVERPMTADWIAMRPVG
jgi:hypothetical protein